MKVNIYCLYDPSTCKIRYIGRTRKDLNIRLIEHISKSLNFSKYNSSKPPHRINWINSLINNGLYPKIKLLCTVDGWEYSHKIERELINKYKGKLKLVNSDDRGEGAKNKIVTQETKTQISNSLKERYRKNEIKKKMTPVYIFNKNGILIDKKESMTAASIFFKCSLKRIDNHLFSKKSISGYFISKNNILNVEDYFYIYNIVSKEVLIFDTQLDIMNFLNISRFIYQKVNSSKIPIANWIINSFSPNLKKKITLYKGGIEYEFDTIKEASLFIGCGVYAIYDMIKGRTKSVYKYKLNK